MSDTYYGTDKPERISYLEFGSIDLVNSNKEVWGYHLHQEAYDRYMLSRYASDIAVFADLSEALRKLGASEIITDYLNRIHHHDMLNVLLRQRCASASTGKRFFELGQTLMGCIDGMEFLDELLAHNNIEFTAPALKDISWLGVDISPLFNTLSKKMHPMYSVETNLPENAPDHFDVFYARGVTLMYAVQSVEDVMGWVDKSQLALFDCSFSTGTGSSRVIPTGKKVYFPALQNFVEEHNLRGRSLFIAEEKNYHPDGAELVCVNCLSAAENICQTFLDIESETRAQLNKAGLSEAFVSLKEGGLDWMPAEEFMKSQASIA